MEHHIVHIKASKKQLSKLRNGHKVRISPAVEGTGFNLLIHPDRYSMVSRTFNKGKGMELQLSPEEIMINQQASPHLEGTGIFGDKFDRFVEKTIGKKAKDVIYKGADSLKAPIKQGIDKIAQYAPELGASALSGLAVASGNPELVPLAGMLGHKLGSYVGNRGADVAKDYLDHPSNYQRGFTSNAGGTRNPIAPTTLAGQVSQNNLLNNLNQDLGTNFGKLAKANLFNALAHMDRSKMTTAQIALDHQLGDESLFGTGLYAGGSLRARKSREISSIGKGASLVGSQSHLPPALMSQPFSANFQFQHFLPPAYQKFSKGGGLYA